MLKPMAYVISRRHFATTALLALPGPAGAGDVLGVGELFPTQPPDLAREMVTVSHFNLRRVQELVGGRPSLVRATWDWGFGDWENALGAASHMGNRAIAEFLIEHGATPSLFSATMMGQLELVKAFVAARPGVQKEPGPHSISLLAHAKAGGAGAVPVYRFLQSIGDADAPPVAPLSDVDQASVLGRYRFGSGPTEEVEVSVDSGHLTWTRKGTMGRWLFHEGERVFHPAGASAVRIRFREEGGAMLMTVSDPDVVLRARRTDKARGQDL